MSDSDSCRLCGESKDLRNSHIVPEFLYQPLYDHKHRAVAIKPGPTSQEKTIQKGLREYLLCQACETQFSRYEACGADVLGSLPDWSAVKPGDLAIAPDCDYVKFKLFQMSLIWRMGVTTLRTFEAVNLGPHEPALRHKLRNEDPGEELQYCCALISTVGLGRASQFLKPPVGHRFNGHRVYVAFFVGLCWVFFVSGHSSQILQTSSFLSKTGDLPINVSSRTVDQMWAAVARGLHECGVI